MIHNGCPDDTYVTTSLIIACCQDDTSSPGTRRSSRLHRPSGLYDEHFMLLKHPEHDHHEDDEDDHVILTVDYEQHHKDANDSDPGRNSSSKSSMAKKQSTTKSTLQKAKAALGLKETKLTATPEETGASLHEQPGANVQQPEPPVWPKERFLFDLFKKKDRSMCNLFYLALLLCK